MACTETYAALRIFSKNISPDIIGMRLGFSATEMIPLDPNSRYKVRRECNFWSWSTKGIIDSTDNIEHLYKIIEHLKGKENLMSELREDGCSTDIFCYWSSTGQGGPFLDIKTMESFVKLGLEISWDMYFDGEDET
jgi:hypothetical protein